MLVDFHLHSLLSDGSHSPEVVMRLAKEKGINAISLTDHDTYLGTMEAMKIATRLNMIFIDGVEIQADLTKERYEHILAYGIHDVNKLNSFLENLREERIENIINNIRILQKQGYNINLEMLDNLTPGRHLTIGHIKKWLHRNSAVSDIVISKLSNTYHYYDEIINLIKKCGGIAILAHPFRYNPTFYNNPEKLEEQIAILKEAGLDGIEAYYSTHDKRQIEICKHIARKYNLIKTGGSDWHGWSDLTPMGIQMSEKDIHTLLDLIKK